MIPHIPLTTNIVANTRQQKQLGSSNIAILLGIFNKTIIPLTLVGYEIIIANLALHTSLAIYHFDSLQWGGGGYFFTLTPLECPNYNQ